MPFVHDGGSCLLVKCRHPADPGITLPETWFYKSVANLRGHTKIVQDDNFIPLQILYHYYY
jgi:hypothetical protein